MLVGLCFLGPEKGRTNSVQKQLIKPLLNEKDGPVFKMADDPRITRVGHFIRKTSIDELPQFLNVLFGQIPLRILKRARSSLRNPWVRSRFPPNLARTKKRRFRRLRAVSRAACGRVASPTAILTSLAAWKLNFLQNPFSGRCARSGKRIHGRHRAWEDEARCLCRRA